MTLGGRSQHDSTEFHRRRQSWPGGEVPGPDLPPEAGKAVPINRNESHDVGRDEGDDEPRIEGVYVISVAARLLDMHPQTLRKYERMGFISPSRTVGRLRLYSNEDIAKLHLIKYLVEELGLNLAGVDLAVGLADRIMAMRRQIASIQEAQRLRSMMEGMLEEMLRLLNAQVPQDRRGPSDLNNSGGPSA